jgi:hypothetical protein
VLWEWASLPQRPHSSAGAKERARRGRESLGAWFAHAHVHVLSVPPPEEVPACERVGDSGQELWTRYHAALAAVCKQAASVDLGRWQALRAGAEGARNEVRPPPLSAPSARAAAHASRSRQVGAPWMELCRRCAAARPPLVSPETLGARLRALARARDCGDGELKALAADLALRCARHA